jgi:hypothetical protein
MIVQVLAGLLLLVQAALVLNVVCGENPRGERAWGTMLVGASLLGAFALFGWIE